MHRVARHHVALLAVFSELYLAPTLCAARDSEPEIRVSDTSQPSGSAWATRGFRLQLRFGWESLRQQGPAPRLRAATVAIEPAYRVSRWLSLGLGLRYSVSRQTEWQGVRWSTTADLTLHPFGGALVTFGAGYGGLMIKKDLPPSYFVVTEEERRSPPPGFDDIVRCNGDGGIGVVRIGYLVPVGQSFATGPVLQGDVQATRCRGDFVDVRVAAWAKKVEWWWHETVQLTWSLAWR